MRDKDLSIEYITRVALSFQTEREFYLREPRLYKVARQKNWLSKVLYHINGEDIQSAKMSFEETVQIAHKYKTLHDFYSDDRATYDYARRKGWLPKLRNSVK